MFNKTHAAILATVAALTACTSTSGPTFNLKEIQASNGQKVLRAECYGVFESGSACMAAAQKACGDRAVNLLQNVEGTKTPGNPSELVFTCAAPAAPVVQSPAPQAAPVVPDAVTRKISLDEKTNFAFDSAQLTPKAKTILTEVIKEGHGTTFSSVSIEGYTDSVGSAPYNLALSRRRAQSVLDYLKAHGLKSQDYSLQGFGKARPVATNATSAGRAENRRVEVTLKQ